MSGGKGLEIAEPEETSREDTTELPLKPELLTNTVIVGIVDGEPTRVEECVHNRLRMKCPISFNPVQSLARLRT